MIRYIITCKIPIALSNCQTSILVSILKYNITNYPNFLLNNFDENISLEILNNGKKKIRLVDINNNKKDIRSADINK